MFSSTHAERAHIRAQHAIFHRLIHSSYIFFATHRCNLLSDEIQQHETSHNLSASFDHFNASLCIHRFLKIKLLLCQKSKISSIVRSEPTYTKI